MRRRTTLSTDRHTIRRSLAAIALAGLATAGLSAGALGAPAQAAEDPPTTSSIHEESARIAAADYRSSAQKDRGSKATREAQITRIRESVVKRALAQVGDDYASGASGPNAFDCSGLMLYAWRAAGVRLEHYSYAQYKATEHIPLSQAVPGDLAFYFENGAHHVAMYIGNGKVVHASDYGIGVVLGTVKGTSWTNEHFTGMGRVKIPLK